MMRAKLRVGSVFPNRNADGVVVSEAVNFYGVSKKGAYPEDGLDEDNTFAKFSPSINLTMIIANPALLGKLSIGEAYYVDFTPAEG